MLHCCSITKICSTFPQKYPSLKSKTPVLPSPSLSVFQSSLSNPQTPCWNLFLYLFLTWRTCILYLFLDSLTHLLLLVSLHQHLLLPRLLLLVGGFVLLFVWWLVTFCASICLSGVLLVFFLHLLLSCPLVTKQKLTKHQKVEAQTLTKRKGYEGEAGAGLSRNR